MSPISCSRHTRPNRTVWMPPWQAGSGPAPTTRTTAIPPHIRPASPGSPAAGTLGTLIPASGGPSRSSGPILARGWSGLTVSSPRRWKSWMTATWRWPSVTWGDPYTCWATWRPRPTCTWTHICHRLTAIPTSCGSTRMTGPIRESGSRSILWGRAGTWPSPTCPAGPNWELTYRASSTPPADTTGGAAPGKRSGSSVPKATMR